MQNLTPEVGRGYRSHYVFLLGLNEQERDFCEIEAAQQNWTLRDLKRQFNSGLYEPLPLSRDKKAIHELCPPGARSFKTTGHSEGALCLRVPWTREQCGLL
jgi:hypothetical protein